ncbi:hypothetical protein ACRAWF_01900 [Streptomyces sp. L7]
MLVTISVFAFLMLPAALRVFYELDSGCAGAHCGRIAAEWSAAVAQRFRKSCAPAFRPAKVVGAQDFWFAAAATAAPKPGRDGGSRRTNGKNWFVTAIPRTRQRGRVVHPDASPSLMVQKRHSFLAVAREALSTDRAGGVSAADSNWAG